MPGWLCSVASGLFAISSWPLLYRFLSRSTLHLPNSFSTQSAVAEIVRSSVSEPSNVFIIDHHRSVLPCLFVEYGKANFVSHWQSSKEQPAVFLTACLAAARRVIRHLSFRGTSKVWMWLFLNWNYLSKAQQCWSLCCFGRAGQAPDW